MSLQFYRYMNPIEFSRELDALHVFRGEYVGDALLETLEEERLVIPHTRIRYPDPVARRFWRERHEGITLKGVTEPDGARWKAAVELHNALHRWCNLRAYGPSIHPLDEPDNRLTEFLQHPENIPFQRWNELCVDVSNDVYPTLVDGGNVDTFYSTWQMLLAAEVADMGVHFRVNLADAAIRRSAYEAVQGGRLPPGNTYSFTSPVRAIRGFNEHRKALDSVVWYAEEANRALMEILKGESGRFQMSEPQNERYMQTRRQIADKSSLRFQVAIHDLLQLCRFLCERWNDWNREGRSLIADAYKGFLTEAQYLSRAIGNLSFTEIRDQIGIVGGWSKPILDVIWPHWQQEEKDRVRRTLNTQKGTSGSGNLSPADIDAFVQFLGHNNLEAFFWRLRSFEDHAFRGNEFALEGMRSDLQGMAVAVEHVARALGGNGDQLYELFKQLWRRPDILALLKRGDIAKLARQGKLLQHWPALRSQIEALRTQGVAGSIAADLVMAHRIRREVHHPLPEDNQFELERLFVGLLRAAALTFVEVRRASSG